MTAPPLPREVSRAFDALAAPIGRRLLQVRALIFATAAAHEQVGRLTETLKWGEPAYLTEATGSGNAAVRTTKDVVSSLAVAGPEKLSQDRPCIGSSAKPMAITACGLTK